MQQPQDFSALFQLANTPAGRQLIALLQQSGGSELQSAIASASAGNYAQAQKTISKLLDTPEAKQLLEQLGGSK